MACLTDEQLARVALGLDEGETLHEHVAQCAACQARLAAMSRLTNQLAAAHTEVGRTHADSRERLLAAIGREPEPVRRARQLRRFTSFLGGLNMRQRIAVGGIGLSTAVIILMVIVFANPARELSAMERIVKAVREVTSFSFRWSNRVTYSRSVQKKGKPTVIEQTCNVYWRAPGPGNEEWFGDLAAPMKSVGLYSDASNQRKPELRIDLTEVYPTGKPGILIDFLRKYYFWTPPLPASDLSKVSPVAMLVTVRNGSCEVVRELGTRKIEGSDARGYVLNVKDAAAFPHVEEVEVWVDPATDLPIEFHFEEGVEGKYTDQFRITDCRWNITLDDKLFDTTPPEGFTNATWPREQKEIDDIVAALRLYAELSGGKYPELLKFDREALRRQKLEKTGFTGTPQLRLTDEPKYQQIERAMPALQRLADVLHANYHTGYYAEKVGAQDKDKVLLWWPPDRPSKGYLVFYGDLRSEHVSAAKLVELEPATEHLVVYEDD